MTGMWHKRETRFIAGLGLAMSLILVAYIFLGGNSQEETSPVLVISEFMADNDGLFLDDFQEPSDWIEILNLSDKSVNLNGYTLTDNHALPLKWRFPRLLLPAGQRMLVFASGRDQVDPRHPLHTNFRLDATGEYLALIGPDGMTATTEYLPKFPPQKASLSQGAAAGSVSPAWLTRDHVTLAQPTPGDPNAKQYLGEAPLVRFTPPHGIQDRPLDVTLSCDQSEASLFYTLDGSDPAQGGGIPYTAPIRVDKTTVIRAAALLEGYRNKTATAQTYLFPEDILQQSPNGEPPPGFPDSWGSNVVDYGMDPEIVYDPRYKDLMIDALKALPSFSMVIDPRHLFDFRTGIYSNPENSGRNWERPASLELIYTDEREGFTTPSGIRIRGGFSRSTRNPKHAFRVFFRDTYGAPELRYPVFGKTGATSFENFDLRTFQNYSWSFQGDPRGVFIRDVFSRDTQLAMGHPGARGDYYHLYINGHYWGIYNSCERPKASYGASYLGGEKEEYDVIKIRGRGRDEVDEEDSEIIAPNRRGFGRGFMSAYRLFATDGSMEAWKELYELAKEDLSSDAAYQRLLGNHADGRPNPDFPVYLDPVNLIDYMLVILYGGNRDAPVVMMGTGPNNFHAMRNRNRREGFKFFIWDAEHTLLDLNENRLGPFDTGRELATSNPQWLWDQCLRNAEFRALAANRIQKHFFNDGVLTPRSCLQRFTKRVAELEIAVVAESARWGDAALGRGGERWGRMRGRANTRGVLNRDDHWIPEVERLIFTYFPRRSNIVLHQLWSIGLVPSLDP